MSHHHHKWLVYSTDGDLKKIQKTSKIENIRTTGVKPRTLIFNIPDIKSQIKLK